MKRVLFYRKRELALTCYVSDEDVESLIDSHLEGRGISFDCPRTKTVNSLPSRFLKKHIMLIENFSG